MKILRLLTPIFTLLLIALGTTQTDAQMLPGSKHSIITSNTSALIPIVDHTTVNPSNGVITIHYYFELHTRTLKGKQYFLSWDNVRSHVGIHPNRKVRFQLMANKCKAFAYKWYGWGNSANNTPYHSTTISITGNTATGAMGSGTSISRINSISFFLPLPNFTGGGNGSLNLRTILDDDIIIDLVDTYEPGEDNCFLGELAEIDVENPEAYDGATPFGIPEETLPETQDEECLGGSPLLPSNNNTDQELTLTNPFDGTLLIPASSIQANGHIIILGMNGQTLSRKVVFKDTPSSIDLNHLPAGAYFLKIQSGDDVKSQMIFKSQN